MPQKPNQIAMRVAMGMNRHERRRLAKLNDLDKIPGANKPFVKPKHKKR